MSDASKTAALTRPEPFQEGLLAWDPSLPTPTALIGSSCPHCGRRMFPRRPQCPGCGNATTDTSLHRDGTIYAATIVRVPSPVGLKPPYAYGLVDLNDGGPRIHALFTGAPVETFVPGLPVEVVFEDLCTGKNLIAYKFRPRIEGKSS